MVKKQRQSFITVLDIGGSKVVCFIAKVISAKQLHVVGIGYHVSKGIKAGRITDIKEAENSISMAVEAAEKMSGHRVQRLYVSLPSNILLSQRMHSEIMVAGHEVNERDLQRLLLQLLDKYQEQDLEVIHSFACDYILDGENGVRNPIGLYGNHLATELHIIASNRASLLNLATCLAHCQLEVENYLSSAYATALSCLTPDEMEVGVILLDMGGSATSISVFHRGQMLFTDGIPVGGIHITQDIAQGLATDLHSAERVKNLLGTTIMTVNDNNDVFEVPINNKTTDLEMNVVFRTHLIEIIRARVEETLEILQSKLQKNGMARFGGNKIVITGGASQLTGMKEIVAEIFGKAVRIGTPEHIPGLAEYTSGVAFSNAIGMMKYAMEHDEHHIAEYSKKRWWSAIWLWFKENFK